MGNEPALEPPKLLTTRYLKLYPLLGVAVSAVLIPLCVMLMNREHFAVAMVLFPLPMGATLYFNGESALFCVFASLQLPVYGLFLGYGHGIDGLPSFATALAIGHAVLVGLVFMNLL
jgi:hypothetical protein